ncbi:ABC transporter ATP-binding protein [Longirhabdus pacifica]|uniref:ABC transporter ATP-binding protein n=1 Tax=Longirhabdus pacifica TaxID=2305227 RepID=UPI00100934F3|nr:dipeptide ABC transporter ATP-binding protein [Longirhabdus pacifica]
MSKTLLQVHNLKKHFPIYGGILNKKVGEVKAVDGLTFSVKEGETLSLVGESGCGKSTTGRLIMQLIEPTDGSVIFEDQSLTELSKKQVRLTRERMQMIFQDPYASLNPRHSVQKILEEPLIVHGIGSKEERKQRVKEMLEVVGLSSYHAKRYPHQFSGGQRQRIGIARALMTKPKLIIADEPVSALDVSIQAQVLNLLQDLQKKFQLTYIFIAHDLGVVRHISKSVAVMYLGRIVEIADSETLYNGALHPYTKALLSSVPIPDPTIQKESIPLSGDLPDPSKPPQGCAFHSRCEACMDVCKTQKPTLMEVEKDHYVACHLYEEDKQFNDK